MSAVETVYDFAWSRALVDAEDSAPSAGSAPTVSNVDASSGGEPSGGAYVPSGHDLLSKHFRRELEAVDPDGTGASRLDDMRSAARFAVLHALAEVHWTAEIGPFYDGDSVRTLLGRGGAPVSRQAVSQRRDLLALRTGSGRVVYPAFQFDGRSPVAGLRAVLEVFETVSVSPWTLASWLSSRSSELDGRTPVEALRSGDVDAVRDVAVRWASALRA